MTGAGRNSVDVPRDERKSGKPMSEEDEGERVEGERGGGGGDRKLVGAAFSAAKVKKMVTPELKRILELEYNATLAVINPGLPIEDQGHFCVILHKVRGNSLWKRNLSHYSENVNPECVILDELGSIEALESREVSFLKLFPTGPVEFLRKEGCTSFTFRAPRQTVVDLKLERVMAEEEATKVMQDLPCPQVAKPLVIDPSGSHRVYLLRRAKDLLNLQKMERGGGVVLQEYVNHSGVVMKAYNFGDRGLYCDPRRSFDDCAANFREGAALEVTEEESEGPLVLKSVSGEPERLEKLEVATGLEGRELVEICSRICEHARKALDLSMFNIDLAFSRREDVHLDVYALDVNYMPGYHKLEGYEAFFGKFLGELASKEH